MIPSPSEPQPAALLVQHVAGLLARAGVASPRADAHELLEHVTGLTRTEVLLGAVVEPPAREQVLALAARRAAREPLQHITGSAFFRTLRLAVGPGVFVPRPETEVVVQAGADLLPATGPATVVDLCAGSGAVALSLAVERPLTRVFAVELSDRALDWLRVNVLAASDRVAEARSVVTIVPADATAVGRAHQPLAGLAATADLVISNPPYVPDAAVPRDPEAARFDPGLALYGGPDGLDVVRGLLGSAAALLRPGGALVLEHAEVQGGTGPGSVGALLAGHPAAGCSWQRIRTGLDLTGRPRYTVARLAAGPPTGGQGA